MRYEFLFLFMNLLHVVGSCTITLFLLQLVILIPNLLPKSSTFTKSIPPLHDLADVSMLTRGDAEKVVQFKEFLLRYLETCKSNETVSDS